MVEEATILSRLDRIEIYLKELTHPGEWMDLTQAARYSSLSRSSILRAIRAGHLKCSRVTGKILVKRTMLDRFIMTGDNRRLTSVESTMLKEELL